MGGPQQAGCPAPLPPGVTGEGHQCHAWMGEAVSMSLLDGNPGPRSGEGDPRTPLGSVCPVSLRPASPLQPPPALYPTSHPVSCPLV